MVVPDEVIAIHAYQTWLQARARCAALRPADGDRAREHQRGRRKAGGSYIPVRGGSTAAANKIPLLNAISTISS